MHDRLTRRDAVRGMVSTGAAAMLTGMPAPGAELPLSVGGKSVEVSLFSVSPRTVRVTIRAIEGGEPEPLADDGALVSAAAGQPAAHFRSLSGKRETRCGELRVSLTSPPLAIRIGEPGGRLVQELAAGPESGLTFSIGSQPLFGLGQGGPQFDRRGTRDEMTSGQGGYHLGTHGARVPVPFLIGSSGWGLFVHSPLGGFDLTGETGHLRPYPGDPLLPIEVFVICAAEPAGILAEYAKITGLPEMPPLWSLGYQQSHRTLDGPETILEEARLFREKKLPCDTMIYLGTGFCPNGWNTDNGEFAWNARAFPNPASAIQGLHDQHFKVALHVVLEGERLTGSVNDPCTSPPLPTGRTADHHWPPDRQAACYWPAHKPLCDLGVDGWWPDQGDGLDAASRLARIRMYFEGQQMYRPNERVFALHRNGYAGMQRYAAFLWSGDVLSRWETLKTHIPVAINTGLSGIPLWGTDIGGFIPTDEYTGELYARWFQFAAFCPLFRSHGRDWKLHRPWGWTDGEIGYPETPSYHPDAAVLHNPAIEPICKSYLELRYRLMPYLYSAVHETCRTGLPIIRAMWLHHPDDSNAVSRGDQYLYGRDILVAPVTERGAVARTVYLPRGDWYDFWTHEKIAGGREITRPVDLTTMPLYVRAGAVIPSGPVRQYTGEPVEETMQLTLHPGADGSAQLYSDDGASLDFKRGEFMNLRMQWRDASRHLSLQLAPGARMVRGPIELSVTIAGSGARKQVRFSGAPAEVEL